jgi:ankyrin repeat protein
MLRSPKNPLSSPGKGLHHSLLAACRVGDLQTAQAAVAQLSTALAKATSSTEKTKIHLTLSACEPSGWTALLYAARNGWAELAQQLLAAAPSLATPSNAKLSSSGNTGEQLPEKDAPAFSDVWNVCGGCTETSSAVLAGECTGAS